MDYICYFYAFYVYNKEGNLVFGSPWMGIVSHVTLEEVNCEPYVNFGTTYLHGVASTTLFPSGYFSEDGTSYDNQKEIELFKPLQFHMSDEALFARVRQVYNSMMSFIVNPAIVDKKSIKAAAVHYEDKSRLADTWADAVWKVVREDKGSPAVMKNKLEGMCKVIERYITEKPDFFMDSIIDVLDATH